MEHDVEITAESILSAGQPSMHIEIPAESGGVQAASAAQIVDSFRQRFAKACDAGVRKRLTNAIWEPANPFAAKSRRRVRQEAIVLGALVLITLGLTAYFNLNALLR